MADSDTGPLLWHFEENTTNDPSIELDLEEVKILAAHMGFEIKVDPSSPQFVSRALAYSFHRMNARSIRPTSITKNQCLGIYTTPLSGLPQKSCNFFKAIPKRKVYRIDITDGPVRLVDMTWTGGGTDVDIIRGYCNLVVRLPFFPKSFLLRLDNDLARVMTVIPTSPPHPLFSRY